MEYDTNLHDVRNHKRMIFEGLNNVHRIVVPAALMETVVVPVAAEGTLLLHCEGAGAEHRLQRSLGTGGNEGQLREGRGGSFSSGGHAGAAHARRGGGDDLQVCGLLSTGKSGPYWCDGCMLMLVPTGAVCPLSGSLQKLLLGGRQPLLRSGLFQVNAGCLGGRGGIGGGDDDFAHVQ